MERLQAKHIKSFKDIKKTKGKFYLFGYKTDCKYCDMIANEIVDYVKKNSENSALIEIDDKKKEQFKEMYNETYKGVPNISVFFDRTLEKSFVGIFEVKEFLKID
jgi:thiol-disulfide isomerase/thioredoxin